MWIQNITQYERQIWTCMLVLRQTFFVLHQLVADVVEFAYVPFIGYPCGGCLFKVAASVGRILSCQ